MRAGRREAREVFRLGTSNRRAQQIFDQFLSHSRNLAPAEQRDLAELLIQMDRSAEAIRLLRPLYQTDPADEAVIVNLSLAEVRLNNRLGALALLDRAAETPLKDGGLWREFAMRLYREHADTEALAVFQRIVRDALPSHRSDHGRENAFAAV